MKKMSLLLNIDSQEYPPQELKSNFTLLEKRPYSEFIWYVFSRIWIEHEEILRISPYSVQVQENRNNCTSDGGRTHTTFKMNSFATIDNN